MKPHILEAAEAHALAQYPNESCGLVVARKRRHFYHPCRNIADDPKSDFIVHPEDAAQAEAEGEVIMLIHSHPDGAPRPSPEDVKRCNLSEMPWGIIALHGDPAFPGAIPKIVGNVVIEPDNFEIPLIGRDFVFGVQDCYTLCQDFYAREMGIVLPDFERQDKFWERGEELYLENFRKAGFEPIPEPTQEGDGILMAIKSDIVNHAGIWLGDRDHMLHHPYDRLSERTVYGGFWYENTRLFVRKVR